MNQLSENPVVLPSELAQALASYLEQNRSFIEPEYIFNDEGGKYINWFEVNLTLLAKTIQDFYDSLL